MRYSDECYFGVLLFIVLLWAILHCRRKSSHASENNDHGTTNDDDHVIITIKKLNGIKPSVLRSIPIVDFNAKDFKESVECVICLSEFVDEDKARVLPTCNHLFHVDCIDSWFLYHSTCPICRSEIRGIPTESSPMSTEAVADCGGADEGSPDLTAVVIDIS